MTPQLIPNVISHIHVDNHLILSVVNLTGSGSKMASEGLGMSARICKFVNKQQRPSYLLSY